MSAAPRLLKVLKLSIEVVRGPNQGQTFAFEKSSITIGRGPENDLVLGLDVKVSRRHLELVVTPQQVAVKNLSLKNPFAVDGEQKNEAVLKPGSRLRLGESELKIDFEKPAAEAASPRGLSSSSGGLAPVKLESLQVAGAPPKPAGLPANLKGPQPSAPPPAPWSAQAQAVANTTAQQPSIWGSQPASPRPAPPRPSARRPAEASDGYASSYQAPSDSGSSSKFFFYIVVAAVVLGGAYFFNQEQVKKKTQLHLKDAVTTEISINESQSEYDKTLKQIEKRGEDTIQYKMAEEQYLRGFRDYRQGQYVRAMEEFQASLSFYPGHELARKYYSLAKRKFDEQVQFNMIQGKRYYGVANYRLCMGYYSTVIKMKKDERDPVRREALQYYNECELKLRGKY